ncbi:hypothetical protein AJ78_08956, partial [Emergomyces pasteurianus Ep9510]
KSWIQSLNQSPLNSEDFNLSPRTLDAIHLELSQNINILDSSTEIFSAGEAVADLEGRVTHLEDRLKLLQSTLKDLLKYVVGLEPWTKTVTDVLKKLGQGPASAPPSVTQFKFEMNEDT